MSPQVCSICALLLPLLAVTLRCRAQNVEFSISNFTGADILLKGNCSVAPEGFLQLAVNAGEPEGHAGAKIVSRAVYGSRVQFYDTRTGAEASFNVSFTFRMQSVPGHKIGDGMTFVIAPSHEARPQPSNAYGAGSIGLYVDPVNPPGNPNWKELAVEFDTAYDVHVDPVGDSNHVGLDINDFHSVKWQNLSVYGIELIDRNTSATEASPALSAWIDYSADRQELLVYMAVGEGSHKSNASLVLSYSGLKVSGIVKPYSCVGFTADTGEYYIQNTYVYNWSFSSSGLPEPQPGKKSNAGLVAGVAIGAALVVVALGSGLLGFFCCRSGGSSRKEDLA